VVLRLLILKHARNWSYQELEREVRANLVYRDFTRIGGEKVPDAKTMGRWGMALGPSVMLEVHDRIVQIARSKNVVQGRRMRVDTTVVERDIHYPTDSSLLGDGIRVLTRTMKRVISEGQRQVLDKMVPLVQQVMRQTKARILHSDTRSEGKIVSVFEPTTEVIRKGKAGKPTEFGKAGEAAGSREPDHRGL
jgi:hypothetical protein